MWKLYLVGASSRRRPSPVSVQCQQWSLLHRTSPPRLKSKFCCNCTERLHSSALRCCNAIQCNISNATYAIQYLYCIFCNAISHKSATLTWNFSVSPSRASFVAIAPLNLIDSNNYSWDERAKKAFKTSKVETTLEQVVLLGTARCRERTSNNYQLITA